MAKYLLNDAGLRNVKPEAKDKHLNDGTAFICWLSPTAQGKGT